MEKKKTQKKKPTNGTEVGTPANKIEVNPELETRLTESNGKVAVFAFGRMNPPTVGHEKLVKKVQDVAKSTRADARIYLSHTQNSKKDPLDYENKYSIARTAFGPIVTKSNAKTPIDVLKELEKAGYSSVVMVAGGDRVREFDNLLKRYNGKDYNFENIDVISAGERDPDAEGVSGMSASKMRQLAADEDVQGFARGLPKRLKSKASYVYDLVRAGMDLAEELEELENELFEAHMDESLTLQQRRKRGQIMRRYKTKIARARERSKKRFATPEKLKKRAQRKAIQMVRRRFAGQKGGDYANLTPGEKIQIDKRIEKKKSLIDKIAKRLIRS